MATMEELMQKAIQQSTAQKKPSELTHWKPDEPWQQSCYAWDAEAEIWEIIKTTPASSSAAVDKATSSKITSIALYSWNIDFMLPCAEARMSAALAHLEELTSRLPSTTAIVIGLQEMTPSDLITISHQPWVRNKLYLTDVDSSAWGSGMYGTTTLVDRRLEVASCFRVHYAATRMERDALFVDVTAPAISPKVIRFSNSHLESLALDPPLRPTQMQVAAKYLHGGGEKEEQLAGAVIAGDFNAIQPFDANLHTDNGLKDACLELGCASVYDNAGATWGQQAHPAARERFGLSRMDKAFFCGSGIKLQAFERIGADVVVGDDKPEQKDKLLQLGFEKAWVTDHLGIKVTFGLVQDTRL
ncbi:endonuclease exonuclease phosphatase family [Apiospora arundinis]|uniref:Tyrosyl-DNA phosphodiesterase 2 n=1 Tax=Apiospora arundinis TaxID=335852 RepID=A0ABR2JLV5_9PEZI